MPEIKSLKHLVILSRHVFNLIGLQEMSGFTTQINTLKKRHFEIHFPYPCPIRYLS